MQKQNKNKKYKHLTKTNRLEIEALLNQSLKQHEIAKVLKVSKSTISREIKKRKTISGSNFRKIKERI